MSPVPAAIADSVASIMIATRSSAIRMPKTNSRVRFSTRRSWKACETIMVDEIETRAPASRLARVPRPKSAATWKPEPEGEAHLDQGHDAGGGDDAPQRAQAELEAEREHQQDDAELGEGADGLFVGEERDGGVRADDDPGEQVTEDHRQPEPLAGDGGERRRAQHQRQVLQEQVGTHRVERLCM